MAIPTYTVQNAKSDTLVSDMAQGAAEGTLTGGNFGSPAAEQLLTFDYDVAAKYEVKQCAIAGTALTSCSHVSGANVAHTAGAKVGMMVNGEHLSQIYTDLAPGKLEFIIDGGGAAITTGVKGDLEIPFACTITGVTALADQSGSIVVDIWKDTYANFPPTDADTITASAPVTISTATKAQDTTLTGWTKALAEGSVLRFNVDSCTSITRVTISLDVDRA